MTDRHEEKSFSLRLGPYRGRAEAAAAAAGLSLYRWVKLAVMEKLDREEGDRDARAAGRAEIAAGRPDGRGCRG